MSAGPAPYFPIEERVARFRRFYQRANERPLLGFFVGSDYPLRQYRASDGLPTDRPLVPEDFAVGPYLDDCDRLFELHEACGGDFIWSASAFWGIPWLEAALGCSIFADHDTGSIHAEPPPGFTPVHGVQDAVPPHPDPLPRERESLSAGRDRSLTGEPFPARAGMLPLPKGEGRGEGEAGAQLQRSGLTGPDSLPAFDENSPWLRLAGEFLDRLAERGKGRWPIGTTRMRGIADLLSALYGGTEFILAMLERPAEVKEVCRKLTDFWIAFARFQLARIPLFHGGIGSFYYNLWAPPGTVWHQEDAAALLSPALYDEFIREHDDRIARAFDAVVMHQHPTKFVPTDFYLRMPFLALELHIDEGGPSAEALHAAHMKILAHKPLIIWGNLSERDLDWVFRKLPHAGLAVITVVSSPEQAGAIWRRCFPTQPPPPM